MDRHWRDIHVYVIRCQFRYYFGEIQLFKDAHARLRWPAYSCAICDLCLHINPKLMMPEFLIHLQDIVCIFFFPVWPWEQFSAGTSNSACVAQIPTYISCISSMYVYNYIHILRATRNDRGPSDNNYAMHKPLNLLNQWLTFRSTCTDSDGFTLF